MELVGLVLRNLLRVKSVKRVKITDAKALESCEKYGSKKYYWELTVSPVVSEGSKGRLANGQKKAIFSNNNAHRDLFADLDYYFPRPKGEDAKDHAHADGKVIKLSEGQDYSEDLCYVAGYFSTYVPTVPHYRINSETKKQEAVVSVALVCFGQKAIVLSDGNVQDAIGESPESIFEGMAKRGLFKVDTNAKTVDAHKAETEDLGSDDEDKSSDDE